MRWLGVVGVFRWPALAGEGRAGGKAVDGSPVSLVVAVQESNRCSCHRMHSSSSCTDSCLAARR